MVLLVYSEDGSIRNLGVLCNDNPPHQAIEVDRIRCSLARVARHGAYLYKSYVILRGGLESKGVYHIDS